MTPFIVRHASAADCVQLSHVACRTFAMACPASTPALEIARHIEGNLQPDHFGELLLQPGKIVLALEVDNQLIGYSLLTLDPEPVGIELADGVQEFSRCYVAPEFHGTGAAGFLMNESLKHLTGPVRLSVSEENSRAIRFYQRQGFRIVGETYFQCGDERQRDWLMLRD
ncbi:GNAT family N-acetyltransferase [Pseudomonas vanderleydeniana]|uniref:GNAT family N-acetyltransferase n=1 Tax=Pseudomonas vanderleydeniana TaxID=2745495 RepID=A0A9E6PQM8_9PSED|nr:GNAT family N-acetyltransferase [Pseudomonas vanderleydeniana]QXI31282.1 GNAT family N-acetyltransferase [Pseudomonas vanderleydeniana]